MNEALISFKTAKLAKEKGFSWKNIEYTNNAGSIGYRQCYNYKGQLILPKIYNPNNIHYPACNQSLLQKWLREIHGIHLLIIPTITSNWTYKSITVISKRDNDVLLGIKSISDLPPYKDVCGEDFSSYEKALEAALLESLKLII